MGGICVDLAKTKFSNTLMLRGGSFEVVCVCVCVYIPLEAESSQWRSHNRHYGKGETHVCRGGGGCLVLLGPDYACVCVHCSIIAHASKVRISAHIRALPYPQLTFLGSRPDPLSPFSSKPKDKTCHPAPSPGTMQMRCKCIVSSAPDRCVERGVEKRTLQRH